MATDLNAHFPRLLGLEWPASLGGEAYAAAFTDVHMMRHLSTVTETIESVELASVSAVRGTGIYALEIYPAGSETPSGYAANVFQPNADISTVGWVPTAGTIASVLDESPDAGDSDTSYIYVAAPNTGAATTLEFNTGAYTLTRRIAQVQIRVRARKGTLYFFLQRGTGGGVSFPGPVKTLTFGDDFEVKTFSWGEVEWASDRVLNSTDIREFDNVAGPGWGLRVDAHAAGVEVAAVEMVVHGFTENRLAVATAQLSSGTVHTLTVRNPNTGVVGWAKANATSYSYVFRRLNDNLAGGRAGWSYMESDRASPSGQVHYLTGLSSFGTVSTVPFVSGRQRTFYLVLRKAAAVASTDAMWPYQLFAPTAPALGVASWQQVTPASTQTYQAVMLVVTPPPRGATSYLLLSLTTDAGAVIASSYISLNREQVLRGEPLLGGWYLVQIDLPVPAVLTGGTKYRINVGNAATVTSVADWTLGVLAATAVGNAALTFGSSTNSAAFPLFGVVTNLTYADWPWMLAQTPAGPGGLTVTPAYQEVQAGGGDCRIEQIPYLTVAWTATALGAQFGRYEVERWDGVDGRWEVIAIGTTEATVSVRDTEFRYNTPTRYRIRVVNELGVRSLPGTEVEVNVAAPGVGYYFSRSGRPDLLYGAPDTYEGRSATRSFTRPAAAETVMQRYHDRDGYVAISPVEWRGVQFSRPLLLWQAETAPSRPIPDAAAALVALSADTTAPYVCVRDEAGGRWFAHVAVPDLSQAEPAHIQIARVDVTELVRVPEPVAF